MKTKITMIEKLRNALFLLLAVCSFVQLSAQTFEAESFAGSLYAEVKDAELFSGGKFITLNAAYGSYVQYVVTVTNAGTYDFAIDYATMNIRRMYIQVENYMPIIAEFDVLTGSWDGSMGEDEDGNPLEGIKTKTIQVYLNQGENTIEIGAFDAPEESFAPNFDKFTITPSAVSIPVPTTLPTSIVKEAESATVVSANVKDAECYSGGKGVFDVSASSELIFENINVASEGVYDLTVYYTTFQGRNLQAKANNYEKTIVKCKINLPYWTCPEEGKEDEHLSDTHPIILKKTAQIYLKAGNNKVSIGGYKSHGPNIDKIEIVKSGYVMDEPEYEVLSSVFDYTDNVLNFKTDITELQITDSTNLSYLIDNNEYTTYVVNGVSSTQIVAKLAYPIILTGYAVAGTLNGSNDLLDDWIVESSQNGSSWTTVSSTQTTNSGFFRKVTTGHKFDNENTVSAQYYRLTATGNNKVEVGEWQLFGSPYLSAEQHFPEDGLMKNVDFENILSSAMGDPDGFNRGTWNEVFENVFDKKLNTTYTVVDQKNFYIQFETPDPIELKSYSLTGRFDFVNRNPSKWKLEAYEPVSGDWSVLDSREDILFPTEGSTLMFNIQDPIKTILYKLSVEDTAGDGTSNLVQWQMFEDWFGINRPIITSNNQIFAPNSDIKVFSQKGKILIRSEKEKSLYYTVFGLNGQVVKKGISNLGLTSVDINNGLYIVRVGDKVEKILVK